MSNWKDVILGYYQILQIAVALSKAFAKIRKAFLKEYDVKEIKENLSSGELHFGDKIKIIGTFSEYLPFIDPKFILTKTPFQMSLPRTARLQAIDDVYCGALFRAEQRDAFSKEVLPIFYGIDSKVLEHYTGEMLELQCQIIQVPEQYRDIMNQNSFFTFEKEEGLHIPFGLKVLGVEPYGLVDEFKINMWLLGNLHPAPHIRKFKEKCCGNCANYFSYMSIDPVDFPFDYACMNFTKDLSIPKKLLKSSKEFAKFEQKGNAYIVFPDIFRQFEVFYPSVDILNETKKKRGKDVLLTTVSKNIEEYFKMPIDSTIIVPKESTLNVDFQYDQLNKITSQTFDANNVPKWQCKHFSPITDLKELEKRKTEYDKIEKEFKLKKTF